MNRLFIIFLLLSSPKILFSQINISIEKVMTEDRMFSGLINNKYEITLYLQRAETSPGHSYIYSVKGWYYYNSTQEKIPLVGIYDGDLTLYHFKSQQKADTVLQFLHQKSEFWEDNEYMKNMQGFDEKLIFLQENKMMQGTWKKGTKVLKAALHTTNMAILKEYELIRIVDNGKLKTITIDDLNVHASDFEVVNFKKVQNEIRVLLEYEMMSRAYALGNCGAGQEIGYILLKFDEKYGLLDLNHVRIESCLESVWSIALPESTEAILQLKISDNETSKNVIIDKKNCRIE